MTEELNLQKRQAIIDTLTIAGYEYAKDIMHECPTSGNEMQSWIDENGLLDVDFLPGEVLVSGTLADIVVLDSELFAEDEDIYSLIDVFMSDCDPSSFFYEGMKKYLLEKFGVEVCQSLYPDETWK